jgi:uncharacterized spore protein YtfJ
MAEPRERPAKRTARKQDEVVPVGDPEHGSPLAQTEGGAPLRGAPLLIERMRDAMTVRHVFGDPIERGGVTVIPAARVTGGGGGGGDVEGNGGGGFGLSARPAGAYVIKDGVVRWEPAIDVTRIAIMGQLVGIVFILAVRSMVKALAKRR